MENFVIQIDKSNKFNQIFIPLAQKFLETLKKNKALNNQKVKIIFGSHANPEYWIKNTFKNDIIVNLEKIYNDDFRSKNPKYLRLLESNTVIDFCSLNSKFLNKHYIIKIPPFFVFPQREVEDKIDKKYDILFVGGTNSERNKILKIIFEKKFNLVTGFNIFSQKLDLSIKQSKIYLHLNFEKNDIFNHFKFAHCCLYDTVYYGHSGNLIDNPELKELVGLSLFPKDEQIIDGLKVLINDAELYEKILLIQKKIAKKYDDNFNLFIKDILL